MVKWSKRSETLSWLNSEVEPRKFHSKILETYLLGQPSRILIMTDVWARGIDVQQVSLVINYDLPA